MESFKSLWPACVVVSVSRTLQGKRHAINCHECYSRRNRANGEEPEHRLHGGEQHQGGRHAEGSQPAEYQAAAAHAEEDGEGVEAHGLPAAAVVEGADDAGEQGVAHVEAEGEDGDRDGRERERPVRREHGRGHRSDEKACGDEQSPAMLIDNRPISGPRKRPGTPYPSRASPIPASPSPKRSCSSTPSQVKTPE